MKYVILGGGKVILFTDDLIHANMVPADGRAARAGYCSLANGIVSVWGESTSLGRKSMQNDAEIIAEKFGLTEAPSLPCGRTVGEVATQMEEWVKHAVALNDLTADDRKMIDEAMKNNHCPLLQKEMERFVQSLKRMND